MPIVTWLLILLGPFLVVGGVAVVADPRGVWEWLCRPVQVPPQRPVTRPRPARWAVV